MRALTISAHGGLDQIEYRDDVPAPEVTRPTDVLVRITAAALNHLDLFVIPGLPGVKIVPPWILGADATGVVEQVGASVAGVRVGETVIINPGISDRTCEFCQAGEQSLCIRFGLLGEHFPGTFAEYAVLPESNLRAIPSTIAADIAAAFTLCTLTAWRMVVSRAQVRPGDEVLIWGIGGGVALAALQIVKHIGARAWVTSGSDAKLERARALGADEAINYRTTDVGKEIRARTGKRGVNVVLDNVGASTWAQSLGALAKGGRLVTCGGTSGPMVETDVRRLFWSQWTIMGSTMGSDAEFESIAAHLRAGRLHPPIDSVFPLEEGRRAFERLEHAEQFGKIVLTVGKRVGEPGHTTERR